MDRDDKFTWEKGDLRHTTLEEAHKKYQEVQAEIRRKQAERDVDRSSHGQ